MKKVTKSKKLKCLNQMWQVDKEGNQLNCYVYGIFSRVTIRLASEKRERELGTICNKFKKFEIYRQKKKHLFRKLNAYGMNLRIVQDSMVERVFIKDDENNAWDIPKNFILENGNVLNFKNSGGFETQIFISLDLLGQFEVKNSQYDMPRIDY